FEHFKRLVQRHSRRYHSLDAHRVKLLKLLQLPRLGSGLQGREGGKRHQLVLRSRDVNLRQLLGRQALGALDLGNNFVASALNAEPVDVISTQHGGQVLPRLAQVHSLRPQLVPVENDLGLRLVVFQIGVGVDEFSAGKGRPHQLFGDGNQLLRFTRRRNHKVNRKRSSPRQRRRGRGDDSNARDLRQ